jgi:acetyl-CoA carboxylase biotin carboxyl carrier protein
MELEELYELMAEFRKSGLGKLKYKTDDFSITLEMPVPPPPFPVATGAAAPAAYIPAAADAPAPDGVGGDRADAPSPQGSFIKAPLVGTYYAAPGEDSEPYVTVGKTVKKGETVCIVEAMKMMNEVEAPCDCIIEEILRQNATVVGFDDPLFRIREI